MCTSLTLAGVISPEFKVHGGNNSFFYTHLKQNNQPASLYLCNCHRRHWGIETAENKVTFIQTLFNSHNYFDFYYYWLTTARLCSQMWLLCSPQPSQTQWPSCLFVPLNSWQKMWQWWNRKNKVRWIQITSSLFIDRSSFEVSPTCLSHSWHMTIFVLLLATPHLPCSHFMKRLVMLETQSGKKFWIFSASTNQN